MPTWSNKIPEGNEYANIPLLRVPKTSWIGGLVLSPTIEGCITHWDNYRTLPCPGADCPHCDKGEIGRWHGFICLLNQVSYRRYVLQLTQIAALDLQQQAARFGALRGLLAQFNRVAPRANAKIKVEVRQLPQPIDNLPEPVDVHAFMELIWQGGQKHRPKQNPPPPQTPQ